MQQNIDAGLWQVAFTMQTDNERDVHKSMGCDS